MDDDAGMVNPGRRAPWWTRPPVLLLSGVGTLIVILAVLFLAGMVQRQQTGPEDVAATGASAVPVPVGSGSSGATDTAAADPSSMTSPSTSASSPSRASSRAADSTTGASTALGTPSTIVTTATTTATTTGASTVSSTSSKTTTPKPTSAAPTARPADLTAPTLTQAAFTARAGSTLRVIFTVTNSGRAGSGPQSVTVSTPPDVTIVDVGIALSPVRSGLRGPATALVPRTPPAARAVSASINCLGATCTYTVPPHMKITVTVTLDIAPTAASGLLQLKAAGHAPSRATLTVQGAVTSPAGPATRTSTSVGTESTPPAEPTTLDESGHGPTA